VVDCSRAAPVLLRKGSVSFEELVLVVPNLLTAESGSDEIARSPGLRHRHYSPRAKVVLIGDPISVDPGPSAAFIGMDRPKDNFELITVCPNISDYARSLFAFFRECDSKAIRTIYCQIVSEVGIGAALMDRLRRAAEE
jgi:L-threonylcarbamoyladenylate synthase